VTRSIRQTAVFVLGACLLLGAASADARSPWARNGADRGGGAMRWQAASALRQILAQGRMSNAERERLRRDLSATQRDRAGSAQRNSRNPNRMTPQQRDSLRRDMRDANRQLDRNRGGNGKARGNARGKQSRGRR
jgi:uncharacterized membrane protein